MTIFTDKRVTAMRTALDEGLTSNPIFRHANFTALLKAGAEELTIRVGPDGGRVVLGEESKPDFSFDGPSDAWEGYLIGDGDVRHASLIGMTIVGDLSGGVLKSSLEAGGDVIRLYANLPIVNRLLEAAARVQGSKA